MVEMNEEQLEDALDEFKQKALGFMPLERFRAITPRGRETVEQASSLKSLSGAISAYLEAIRPQSKGGDDDRVAVSELATTLHLSVYRVIKKNLLGVRHEIDALLRDLVILEDERQ